MTDNTYTSGTRYPREIFNDSEPAETLIRLLDGHGMCSWYGMDYGICSASLDIYFTNIVIQLIKTKGWSLYTGW